MMLCIKSRTRQSRKVLWVVFSSLFFKQISKNGKRGHGHMFASVKGKQKKKVRQLQCQEQVYWSYPILPFGIVACTVFSTTFLEIAVYSGTSIQRRPKGLAKFVRYNVVSLYRGHFSYILLLLAGVKKIVRYTDCTRDFKRNLNAEVLSTCKWNRLVLSCRISNVERLMSDVICWSGN